MPFLAGYGMAVLRKTARGDARPLPEWDDYGKYFMDGLQMIGLYLIHFFAAMLLPGAIGCIAAARRAARPEATRGGGLAGLGMMVAILLVMLLVIPVPCTSRRPTSA